MTIQLLELPFVPGCICRFVGTPISLNTSLLEHHHPSPLIEGGSSSSKTSELASDSIARVILINTQCT